MTEKQEKFCNLYIETGSGAEAYRQAYNVSPNTKVDTCSNNAYKMLQTTEIITRVNELKELTQEKHGIDRAFIINGYLEIISDADYTFKLGKDNKLTKEDKQAFFRIMQQTKNTDKLRALESLAKMLGLNEPDEIKVSVEVIKTKWG